jgi:hypothetical protein
MRAAHLEAQKMMMYSDAEHVMMLARSSNA